MLRRKFLAVVSSLFAAIAAGLVAIPGVAYVLATVARGTRPTKVTRRLVRLSDLAPQVPYEATVQDRRTDGWTTYPQQPVGRVWLVRTSERTAPAEQSTVRAFSATCPHLGCRVHFASGSKRFVCPCHKAEFESSGELVGKEQLGFENPSPRPLDALACKVVQDEQSGEWWVEVEYVEFAQGMRQSVELAS